MSTIKSLKTYQTALEKWKERKGLEGFGGKYDHKEGRYKPAPEPKPEDNGITDAYVLKLAAQIRKQVLG